MIKKILVADNSITIQKIVAMAFENEDAIVEGVSNGKDALDKMETFKPDIVLADVDMQDLSGFNLSKKIKNDPRFNATKILLLASDFEDFNTNLFNNSDADDHISKPFKSEDIIKKVVNLISEISSKPTNEITNLSSTDLDEPENSTINLSSTDLDEPEDSTINLSSTDLDEPEDSTPVKETEQVVETINNEEDTLDKMIKDVESLKKTVAPSDSDYDELGEEVAPTQEDAVGDELDMAFQEIVNFGSREKPDNITSIQLESIGGFSATEGIIPEPEDLLGEITSSMIEGKKRLTAPSLMRGNSSQALQTPHVKGQNIVNESQTVTGQVKHTLEGMIHASIEKELAEISNSITQSVLEIVREITPKIVREIVKEEIDKIKKS
jgi:CheY-like chemotaxis protein